jgi:type IV secretion system protein VirB11
MADDCASGRSSLRVATITPLLPLLDQDGVEDVAVQQPRVAWVRRGGWERFEVRIDLGDLTEIATLAGAMRKTDVGRRNPILDTHVDIPERYRLNALLHPLVDEGNLALTLRKPGSKVFPIEDIPQRYNLDGWGRYTPYRQSRDMDELLALYRSRDPVGFLRAAVQAGLSILIVGSTGAGKTALLNTLAREIPQHKRIVTIEDSFEIDLALPNCVNLLFQRADKVEHKIDSVSLVQAGLRMHPDIMMLGEIRGREAWTLVRDVAPAHRGSITTVHGNSLSAGVKRLRDYCLGGEDAPSDPGTLDRRVADILDVVISMVNVGEKDFRITGSWFVADALARGKTELELLQE